MQHRTRYSAESTAKVALAALSESKTLAELASEYKVHPSQISNWKQELIENSSELFGKGKKKTMPPQIQPQFHTPKITLKTSSVGLKSKYN